MRTVKAYKYTQVNWGKSQAQITKLLEKQGIQSVRELFFQSHHMMNEEETKSIEHYFIISKLNLKE